MAPGLVALRDDGVGATLFEPSGLRRGGCRTDDDATRCFDAPKQVGGRQPEMKTDDFWPQVPDRVAKGCIKGSSIAGWYRDRRINSQLLIKRLQPVTPMRLAGIVEYGWRMAEKIDVDRFFRSGTNVCKLFAQQLRREHRTR